MLATGAQAAWLVCRPGVGTCRRVFRVSRWADAVARHRPAFLGPRRAFHTDFVNPIDKTGVTVIRLQFARLSYVYGCSATRTISWRVNPIDTGPRLRPARDDSGFGIIGLEASI